jgi:hypothetical protein
VSRAVSGQRSTVRQTARESMRLAVCCGAPAFSQPLTLCFRLYSWLNHLNPDVKKGPWAPEEEAALIEGHKCDQCLTRQSSAARAGAIVSSVWWADTDTVMRMIEYGVTSGSRLPRCSPDAVTTPSRTTGTAAHSSKK